jgi:hypothetical protein
MGATPRYPSLAEQAGNLLAAAGRIVAAAVQGEAIMVPAAVLEERKSICAGCEQFDPGPGRCRLCGCYTSRKLTLATESCPLDPPKWNRWE